MPTSWEIEPPASGLDFYCCHNAPRYIYSQSKFHCRNLALCVLFCRYSHSTIWQEKIALSGLPFVR